MLAAEVARTYQDYRVLQRRIAIMDQTVASQREVLAIVRARSSRG
jgi:outer membrane protein TolC